MNTSAPLPTPEPHTRRGIARREALLKAATTAFLEHGYGGTTLDMIIQRAGGSKRTLYDLFGDKAGLFSAVMSELSQNLLQRIERQDLEHSTLAEGLQSYGENFVKFILAPTELALYRVLVAESPTFPELGAEFFHSFPDTIRRRMVQYFEKYMARGELNIDDADMAASQFLGLCAGSLHLRAVLYPASLPSEEQITLFVRRAVDLFLHGLQPRRDGQEPER